MELPFRHYHVFELLEEYDKQDQPLDLFISKYFRANKALGSKDRAFIAESVYALVRWQGLLDHLLPNPQKTWGRRFDCLLGIDPLNFQNDLNIPQHVRVSFPKELFDLIAASHGEEKAAALCLASNFPAPTTVRANILKISREDLLKRWESVHEVSPCTKAPNAIVFHKKMNFFTLPEFKEGLFEVQDEGSQLLADLVQAQPGEWVLDFCAGSGGKTLAFAPAMQNKGQIFLHDIRSWALDEARKRLRRAGIQNAQFVLSDDPKQKKLKKKMHRVLVDAPCSGTGTLRRNPDMKWRFTNEALQRLIGQQRTIFEKALSFLRPDGRIVYATCSLLNQENQDQVAHFLKAYPLELAEEPFQSFPADGGMDGFFAAAFRFKP